MKELLFLSEGPPKAACGARLSALDSVNVHNLLNILNIFKTATYWTFTYTSILSCHFSPSDIPVHVQSFCLSILVHF